MSADLTPPPADKSVDSDAVLVEKLHLTEGQYLKRAATLLFHADPEKFTTGACVKIGFFRTIPICSTTM